MAEYTALAPLFTDIADAIRSKTGETGKIAAHSFPTSITNIKTSNMKIIQVSTSTNVGSEKVQSFIFPVEFTPAGFIGCAGNIIDDAFDGSWYNSNVDTEPSIVSFSYVNGTFFAVANQAIVNNGGISCYYLYGNSTSLPNFRIYDVDITSTQVTISTSSRKNKSFFIQGNYTNGYWYVVYWA